MYYWIYKYCVFNVFVKKLNNNSVSFSNQQEYHTFLLKDMINKHYNYKTHDNRFPNMNNKENTSFTTC